MHGRAHGFGRHLRDPLRRESRERLSQARRAHDRAAARRCASGSRRCRYRACGAPGRRRPSACARSGFETIGQVAACRPSRARAVVGRARPALLLARQRRRSARGRRLAARAQRRLRANVERRRRRRAPRSRRHLRLAADTVAQRLRRSQRRARGVRIKLKTTDFRVAHAAERARRAARTSAPCCSRTRRRCSTNSAERGPFRLVGLAAYDLDRGRTPVAQLELVARSRQPRAAARDGARRARRSLRPRRRAARGRSRPRPRRRRRRESRFSARARTRRLARVAACRGRGLLLELGPAIDGGFDLAFRVAQLVERLLHLAVRTLIERGLVDDGAQLGDLLLEPRDQIGQGVELALQLVRQLALRRPLAGVAADSDASLLRSSARRRRRARDGASSQSL